MNDEIEQIKTPYFKFYELEALCNVGKCHIVLDRMKEYWGAMLKAGATSFWEEYDLTRPWQEQLGNYNLKYAMSLCHAWGASPIYLLGRYFLGIKPTSTGYETFEVRPNIDAFDTLDATIPVKGGFVNIKKNNNRVEVLSDRDGGVLIYKENKYVLQSNKSIVID